jgi:hypothetical protein
MQDTDTGEIFSGIEYTFMISKGNLIGAKIVQCSGGSRNFEKRGPPSERGPTPELTTNSSHFKSQILSYTNILKILSVPL